MSLFAQNQDRPLADRLRPDTLKDVVGQEHLTAIEAPIGRMVGYGRLSSHILWGPPGCGKTTIARLLAKDVGLFFEPLSAVSSGVAALRDVFAGAAARWETGTGTLLFVDEIHRFTRSQQDVLLPFVEDGTVVLVGATTENPSFALNSALLSRAQVLVLKSLNDEAIDRLLRRAERLEEKALPLNEEARQSLVGMADGDGRYALVMAEALLCSHLKTDLDAEGLAAFIQKRPPLYDKAQDSHFNLISAFHKSLRGSDCDAALYWMARMLAGGEDPRYILRRMLAFASEDVGLADPNAMQVALAAWQSFERLGLPEGELPLAEAVIYLATAPKSNASYMALARAKMAAERFGSLAPPKHAMNAPTKLMKDLGYKKDYQYDHDTPEGCSGQNFFPEQMNREDFYQPVERGFERDVKKRAEYYSALRAQKRGS